MDESKRTKLLAGALGIVVFFWMFEPQKALFGPLAEANAKYDNAAADLDEAEIAQTNMLKAKRNMRLWKQQSLPPDDRNAQRVYKQWVEDLAEEAGLSGIKVESGGRPKKRNKKTDGDVYIGIQVKIAAEGTLTELSRFLYRFKRTALLQRIVSLGITSEDIEGDPIMEIDMLAEGVAMTTAAPRLVLFKQSTLAEAIEDDATELTVADIEEFPTEAGFQVQVDKEYMVVTAIDADAKTLTVERGQDDTTANPHDKDARVEWVPVASNMQDVSFAQYKEFLAASPFVKLPPVKDYEPKIQLISEKSVKPGDKLDFRIKTEDFDPSRGGPVFKLADGHPEGMKINEKTGAVEWQTAEDTELDTYKATVLVKQSNNPDVDLSKEFSVEVSVPNNAPVIGVPDERITAWLGQPLTINLDIKDETPAGRLKFSVIGAEGAYIDSQTNAFKWNPPETLEPGDYTATIKVTDREGKEAEAAINIVARDDEARYTKIIGSASVIPEDGEQKEQTIAWMYSTISNKTTKLEVGTEFSVANIVGTVKAIDPRSVTIQTSDGQMELPLGKTLRSGARKIEQAKESPADASDAEEPIKTAAATPPAKARPAEQPTKTEPESPTPAPTEAKPPESKSEPEVGGK